MEHAIERVAHVAVGPDIGAILDAEPSVEVAQVGVSAITDLTHLRGFISHPQVTEQPRSATFRVGRVCNGDDLGVVKPTVPLRRLGAVDFPKDGSPFLFLLSSAVSDF